MIIFLYLNIKFKQLFKQFKLESVIEEIVCSTPINTNKLFEYYIYKKILAENFS